MKLEDRRSIHPGPRGIRGSIRAAAIDSEIPTRLHARGRKGRYAMHLDARSRIRFEWRAGEAWSVEITARRVEADP